MSESPFQVPEDVARSLGRRLHVTSGAEWDFGRNTSRVIPPVPGSWKLAVQSCKALRAREPAFVRWIEEGHPSLTQDEHIARFGGPYERRKS